MQKVAKRNAILATVNGRATLALTDPDHLKSAAEYLLEIARTSEGRRYRKQPTIDALRQYKEQILEAHRHGLNVHRIAEIFRERGVDISKIHLMRAIRRFIEEEERAGSRPSADRPASAGEGTKSQTTYQVAEQPSAVVREEEFAKQLRIARYLAAARLPAGRSLEHAPQVRTPKEARPLTKARPTIKKGAPKQKAEEKELAKERRRAGRAGQKVPSSDPRRAEKQRPARGR
jgi:hypothetical protein